MAEIRTLAFNLLDEIEILENYFGLLKLFEEEVDRGSYHLPVRLELLQEVFQIATQASFERMKTLREQLSGLR